MGMKVNIILNSIRVWDNCLFGWEKSRSVYDSLVFLFFFFLERLNAMLKKLFDAQITGDVHEELVKASANGKKK